MAGLPLWLDYLAGACAAALAIASWRPIWAWRLRKLPGPMRLPLVGNLVSIMASGNMVLWLQEMSKRYGTVFKIWNGSHPMVVITDPELSRKMLMGNTGRPSMEFFTCLTGTEHDMMHSGLLSLSPDKHGAKFRFLRKAFELTVMSPSALAAHAVMLSECASRLVTYLSRYAASGEPVDMTIPLADMTMTAIGFAAFGLDLDCLGQAGTDASQATTEKGSQKDTAWADAPPGSPQFSRGLVEAARIIFKHTDISQGSAWLIPGLLLPSIYDVIRYVANVFPDSLLRTEVKARRGMHKALESLIVEWRRHKAAEPTAGSTGTFSAISDRGFLGNMLSSMGSEQGVRELDVMAQCLTMILAGYETTSSSISATLHLLAQHPEAQARLQRELDEVLKGKLAMAEDLERLPYLCAALDEALRIYPTADGAFRLLSPPDKDVDVGDGRVIPGGSFLWLDFHTFHNDPAIWPRAKEFLPERFVQPGHEELAPSNPHAYLPFGLGARMCPGYKFGLMEGRLTLARLFQAYTFTPAPNCPLPVWKSGIVYTADHVWLTITPRQK